MKVKTIIQIVLAIAILGMAWLLFESINKPMRFENEYNVRREACASNLKNIRTLEEAYKITYGKYTGSFDTLFTRLLNEDSMVISQKVYDYDKIPADVEISEMSDAEAIKKGYMKIVKAYVNPVQQLQEQHKLYYIDKEGDRQDLTKEDILNLRYVPYPKDKKQEFELQAGTIEKNGFQLPVFECKVSLENLLSDLDEQLVRNKIADIERVSNKYAGWKVGDMTQAVTDGNFE